MKGKRRVQQKNRDQIKNETRRNKPPQNKRLRPTVFEKSFRKNDAGDEFRNLDINK
jgi:hypothetical protein